MIHNRHIAQPKLNNAYVALDVSFINFREYLAQRLPLCCYFIFRKEDE